MDKYLGISENEERRIDFLEYGQKILAEGNCKILPYGVLVENGFVMQEVYHGRTFPEYWYDTGETVAVVEVKNQAGDREYLYLPTDIFSVDRMKSRLQIRDLCECRVEEIHNLRLPERLVPEPERLCCVEELTYFNELCQKVSRFDPEQMERLAMAAEFVGAEKYTDITYVAEYLHEFEIVPAVHNDEEHGRFLVDGKEGAEIIIDNCQDTIFGGFAPNSESAEVLSKSLGNRTVLSGSISRGKNDPSQSLQMMQRPLMTPDELKSLPKGNFIVSKTGCHPMKTKLKLFLKWGITFEEPYEIEEKSARKVAYADKQEIEEEIVRRYMCCVDEEQENTRQNTANRNGGMQQTQMNENVARVRQPLRTED